MTATVYLGTAGGEQLMVVEVQAGEPYITLTVRDQCLHLTRDEARRAADALRAGALAAIDPDA